MRRVLTSLRRSIVSSARRQQRAARLSSNVEVFQTLGGAGFPWSLLAFGYSLSDATCTIYPGTIRLHGIGTYSVAQTNVTLTGAVEWVYVEQVKATPATTSIKHSATEPESNVAYRRLPLYKFEAEAGVYSLSSPGGIRHMGDFNFDTPI